MKTLLTKFVGATLLASTLLSVGAPLAQAQSVFDTGAAPVPAIPSQTNVANGTSNVSAYENLGNSANTFNSSTQFPASTQTTGLNSVNSTNGNTGNVSAANSVGTTNAAAGTDLECSTSNISLCISGFVYWITVGIGSWTANIAAYVFDYAVMLSLQSGAYALDVIAVGWGIVRDVANMSFLFILVYIAFKIMFQAETTGTTRMLVWVVIVALLVNFSFVMTRVVIDAGNIVALQFYNAIASASPTINTNNSQQTNAVTGGIPVKDITSSIMTALNPQDIIGVGQFKNFIANPNNSPMYYLIVSSVVYILMGVSLFMVAAVLIFAAVRFVTRVIGLAGLIMIAPAAFVAAIFRGKEGGAKWFNMWLGYLLEFTFYPAVFLFLFYIEVRFMQDMNSVAGKVNLFNGAFNAAGTGTQSWTLIAQALANVGIRLAYIIASLYLILRVSMWSSQAFNKVGTSWVQGRMVGLGRDALKLGGQGVRGGLRFGAGTLGFTGVPLKQRINETYKQSERTGVNARLWRGLNRAAGNTNLTGAQLRTNREADRASDAAKEAAKNKATTQQANQQAQQGTQGQRTQTTGNAGAGATGAATGPATTASNPAATPAARKIPAGRMTNAPGTTAAANPNQAVRPRLQSGPGLAPANLNNLGKILEAVKKSNAEKGQPIFNKANAPIINANFKTNVQQVMKEPIVNPTSQWRAPTTTAQTTPTANIPAASTTINNQTIINNTTPGEKVFNPPAQWRTAKEAVDYERMKEAMRKVIHKEFEKREGGEPSESPTPPAAPAAAKPAPQQSHNNDYPYSQAAE